MIDPNSIVHIEDTTQRTKENQLQVLKFEDIPQYDIEAYDIYSDKDFKKYIQDVEKEVRGSIEYKRAIRYLKEYMGMNESAFLDGIESSSDNKISIELHHSPFTLFDIALIVFNKRLYYGESLELQATAKEVTKLHYYLVVGLVALTKTEHELVHNSYLFVPSHKVLGDYGKFIAYYKNFMSPEQIDLIDRIEEYSLTYNQAQNEIILQNNIITLDTSVSYSLPKFEDVKALMDQKIQEVKDNGYQLLSINDQEAKDISTMNPMYNNTNGLVQAVRFDPKLKTKYTVKR